MLAIAWEYLTGRAVATDPTDRQSPEWPPHPDRVFQALVAAWGEGGQIQAEREALHWLEAATAPALAVPDDRLISQGYRDGTFVPVNDTDGPARGDYGEKHLGILPQHRKRAGRFFPSVVTGSATCALVWPDATPAPTHQAALADLCARVTAIGHSRSLVRVWLEEEPPPLTWEPSRNGRRELNLRVAGPGRLDSLIAAYAAGHRPDTAAWQPYRRAKPADGVHGGAFDARLIILRRSGGDPMPLTSILAWSEALRGALIAAADGQADLLPLVSGHAPDGAAADAPHLAYLPLPDVGHRHADGHLLGLALALPAALDGDAEARLCRLIASTMHPETGVLRLTAGRAGICDLVTEERPAPPRGLRASTWTTTSMSWATVTPIVLDRLPPRRFRPAGPFQSEAARQASDEHAAFDAWVSEQIATACTRQGLPTPVAIELLPVAHWTGAPPAKAFPPLLRKPDGAKRWHTHARLVFPQAIHGPLLLGAGRYRGYGLCRPLDDA